jgi:hypothetical protein
MQPMVAFLTTGELDLPEMVNASRSCLSGELLLNKRVCTRQIPLFSNPVRGFEPQNVSIA